MKVLVKNICKSEEERSQLFTKSLLQTGQFQADRMYIPISTSARPITNELRGNVGKKLIDEKLTGVVTPAQAQRLEEEKLDDF